MTAPPHSTSHTSHPTHPTRPTYLRDVADWQDASLLSGVPPGVERDGEVTLEAGTIARPLTDVHLLQHALRTEPKVWRLGRQVWG
eukprot:50539-Chlamydomonas_euryale.AAC.1